MRSVVRQQSWDSVQLCMSGQKRAAYTVRFNSVSVVANVRTTGAVGKAPRRHTPNTFLTVGYTEPKAWSFAFS